MKLLQKVRHHIFWKTVYIFWSPTKVGHIALYITGGGVWHYVCVVHP